MCIHVLYIYIHILYNHTYVYRGRVLQIITGEKSWEFSKIHWRPYDDQVVGIGILDTDIGYHWYHILDHGDIQ